MKITNVAEILEKCRNGEKVFTIKDTGKKSKGNKYFKLCYNDSPLFVRNKLLEKHSGRIEPKDKRQWDPTLKVLKYKGFVTSEMATGVEEYPEKSELFELCEYIQSFLEEEEIIKQHCEKVKKPLVPICVFPQSGLEDPTFRNASVNFKFQFTGFDPTNFYDLNNKPKELKFNKKPVTLDNIHMLTPGSEFISILDLSTVCLGAFGASLLRRVNIIAFRIAEGKKTSIVDLMDGIKLE